jgi:insertion element IS1 protein InsB
MKPYLICPTCGSDDVIKNGMTRRGKQNHKCRECGRQFVENPQWTAKDTDTLAKIELLLLERISLAGIARVMGVSESWLLALCEPLVRCNRTQSHGHPERSWKTHSPNG